MPQKVDKKAARVKAVDQAKGRANHPHAQVPVGFTRASSPTVHLSTDIEPMKPKDRYKAFVMSTFENLRGKKGVTKPNRTTIDRMYEAHLAKIGYAHEKRLV